MKRNNYILFLLLFESCIQVSKPENPIASQIMTPQLDSIVIVDEKQPLINPTGTTLELRIIPPSTFTRIVADENSFAEFLRGLPLKPHGSEVLMYDGSIKPNFDTYEAVIDLKIGNKNLHQCADAVMRLRAEYLWQQERYDDIHFNFTNGFRVDYSNWMAGQRMIVKGNKTYWIDQETPSNTYPDFWKYMELIFNYAGTLSLSKELKSVAIEAMKIGDVFIWGGLPGHAVIVIDMAVHPDTEEKVFLLAQSYMPAQQTHILQNPNNADLSPWYSVSESQTQLITPEWTFSIEDLKRFEK